MALERLVKTTLLTVFAASLVVFTALRLAPQKVHAGEENSDQNLVEIGLRIAPHFIHIEGKDRDLVGLGSFIANAQADCNGCHGSDPANEYLPTNNPFFLPPNNSPARFNQATYLNGGQNFGPAGPGIVQNPNSPLFGGPGLGPNIITRNLTPDYTGNPEGGVGLEKFIAIMRRGHDYDHLHPNCGGSVTDNCYSAPVNGELLQVMPWPKFRHMTDHQLRAIWT